MCKKSCTVSAWYDVSCSTASLSLINLLNLIVQQSISKKALGQHLAIVTSVRQSGQAQVIDLPSVGNEPKV